MVLTAEQWEKEFKAKEAEKKKLIEEAKQKKIEEEKERRKNLSASFDVTFTKISITSKQPDYSGNIEKKIQVTAEIPFGPDNELAISKVLQEPMVANIGAKQLKMAELDDDQVQWDLFDEDSGIENPLEKFTDETYGDLCECGHERTHHVNNRNKHGKCRVYGEKCDCKAFVPAKEQKAAASK